MNFKTHEMVGALSMELVLVETHASLHWWSPVLVVAAGMVAPIPDIDEPESWIAHKVPFAGVVGRVIRHRTVTHSLLVLMVLWLVLVKLIHFSLPFGLTWTHLAWALWIGYASHTFADLFNPQGVQLFWPLPWWVKVLPAPVAIPVDSVREEILHGLFVGLVVVIGVAFVIAKIHLPFHVPVVVPLAKHILSSITF